jgi:HAD superfamily hydrolase (TIGR01509 family)
MKYEAVLFDMDGVLIDTHDSVTRFWLEVADTHGVQLSDADFAQNIYGCPADQTLDAFFSHLTPGEREAIIDNMIDYEAKLEYEPVRGVVPLLEALRREGVPTALVTSGNREKVGAVMGQLGVGHVFDTKVTEEDIRHGKPDPECYELAARRLGREPARCIVFEDSISGARAAVAAGATCIGVRQPGTEADVLRVGALCTIPDFASVTPEMRDGHLRLYVGGIDLDLVRA